jgi:diaminohydroxyphosphoribosylaminopyrimidine deaminase/5-amino-6-(5-phosphoribosylamino)uracil reductase
LREAGVEVDVGLQVAAVEEQLAGFLARHRRGRGRLRIKMASSADGRTAMASGESQWITGPAARRDVQRLRAESCAIVTGIGTVLADNCALTVREAELPGLRLPEPDRRALRVVLDSSLRTPPGAAVLSAGQDTLLVHDERMEVPEHLRDYPRLPIPLASGRAVGGAADETAADVAATLPLQSVLEHLAERECNEILLESGAALAGAALREGLADELLLYQAPKLLGSRARPLFDLPLDQMGEALEMTLLERRQVGKDLMQRFRLGI